MKGAILRLLSRFGLLLLFFRGWERVRSFRVRTVAVEVDDIPLPPPELIMRVAGTIDTKWFLQGGILAEASIRATLEQAGTSLESRRAILDFGCGCGRVLRRWRDLEARICGSDLSLSAVAWCQARLPFAEVDINALEPPLKYPDGSFDLVYTLSVFTHLPVNTQLAWLNELARVLCRGGYLLLSVHGDAYVGELRGEERWRYANGDCVVRWADVAGSNLCTTFHPPEFVRCRLAEGWELVAYDPCAALGNPEQDIVLLRKPL